MGLECADAITLCEPTEARAVPVASGSFFSPGEDEILLDVWNGRSFVEGDHTLAVMRNGGGGYRLVEHMLMGTALSPWLRLTTSSGRDVLMLCRESTGIGVFPSTCGFLGQGSFSRTAQSSEAPCGRLTAVAADPNEIELRSDLRCGRHTSILLGKIDWRDDRILVELVVEDSVRDLGSEEGDDGGICSQLKSTTRRRFTVAYTFDGTGFRRATPLPKEIQDALRDSHGK